MTGAATGRGPGEVGGGELARAREARAFDPAPSRAELHELHVPYDRLVGGHRCESALLDAMHRGERVALVGGSGSGKSSVVNHVLGPMVEGLAPLPIPVSIERPEVATEQAAFAGHLVHVVTRWVREALPAAGRRGRGVSGSRTHRVIAGAGLGWLGGANVQLGYELKQVTGGEATTSVEMIGQAAEVLATISAHSLRPVLVLDDTDKWLSRPDPAAAAHQRAGFFGSVVRVIAEEFGAAAVIAVHPSYLADETYLSARGFLGVTVEVPALPNLEALRAVLVHRSRLALTEPGKAAPTSAERLIDDDALGLLFDHYQAGDHSDLRGRVLLVVHTAVTMAVDDGLATVTRGVMSAAIAETSGG